MVLIRSMVIIAFNTAAALRMEQMQCKCALKEWLGPMYNVRNNLHSGLEIAFLKIPQNEDRLSQSEEEEATAQLYDLLEKTDEEELLSAAKELAHKRNRKLFYTHPAQMRAIWHRFLDRLDWEGRKDLLKSTLDSSVDDDTIVSSVLLIDVLAQYEIEQAFKPIVNYRMASKKIHLFGNDTNMLQVIIEQAIVPLMELFRQCKQADLYVALKSGKLCAFKASLARKDEIPRNAFEWYGSSFFFDEMGNVLFNRYLEQIQRMIHQIKAEEGFQSVCRVTDENYSEHASKLIDSLLPYALENFLSLDMEGEIFAKKMRSMKKFLVWCSTAARAEALANITLPDDDKWLVLKTFVGEDHIQEHFRRALTAGDGCHFSGASYPPYSDQEVQAYIEKVVVPNIRSAKTTESLDLSNYSSAPPQHVEVDWEADAPVQEQSDEGHEGNSILIPSMILFNYCARARQVYDDVVSESQLALRRSPGQQLRVL